MRIGKLAERSGFSIDTLRYYDKIGLLHPSQRNPVSRFREYGEDAIESAIGRLREWPGRRRDDAAA